jgi:hypothetical protein
MFSGISITEFREKFKTERDCLQYILDIKLAEGYTCLRCQGNQYVKGRDWHYQRCENAAMMPRQQLGHYFISANWDY